MPPWEGGILLCTRRVRSCQPPGGGRYVPPSSPNKAPLWRWGMRKSNLPQTVPTCAFPVWHFVFPLVWWFTGFLQRGARMKISKHIPDSGGVASRKILGFPFHESPALCKTAGRSYRNGNQLGQDVGSQDASKGSDGNPITWLN